MKDIQIARMMVAKADNAKQRGLSFSLSFADAKKLYTRKTCYYTKVHFTNEGGSKRTLDRINSKLGYTPSNTVACTSTVNKLKNRLLEDLSNDMELIKRLIKEIEDAQETRG